MLVDGSEGRGPAVTADDGELSACCVAVRVACRTRVSIEADSEPGPDAGNDDAGDVLYGTDVGLVVASPVSLMDGSAREALNRRESDCSTGDDVDVSELVSGVSMLGSDTAALPSDGRCTCFKRAEARTLDSDEEPGPSGMGVAEEPRSCFTSEVSVGVRSCVDVGKPGLLPLLSRVRCW